MLRTLLLAVALAGLPAPSSAYLALDLPSADEPLHFSTFSICAIDPATGEVGVAVTTRVPGVGVAVPWVKVGVGAVATQALTVVRYGPDGLKLLEEGHDPQATITKLLEKDEQRENRQIGVIDMKGRTAVHTGTKNGAWAGSRQGKNCTVQGNLLVGKETVDAVAESFEATEGRGMELADRLITALAAGHAAGGDKRKGLLQSAAVLVADPRPNRSRRPDQISVNIHVYEHPEPVAELRRIYDTVNRRLGYRTLSELAGPDVVELKRLLKLLGFYKKEVPEAPPPGTPFPEMQKYFQAVGVYDADTIEAVEAFRKENRLPVAADNLGYARGLVDGAMVKLLREKAATAAGR